MQEDDIPCIIISVKKNRKHHIKELHKHICETVKGIESIKMILYVEHSVDPGNLAVALWRFCNNLDPKRDHHFFERHSENADKKGFVCLGLDGTRKTKELDDFHRDWPNIIVADDATIKAVDEKWNGLGIGPFISSPSLLYKDQVYGNEAVVE